MAMPKTTKESLFAKADISGGPDACWIWNGFVNRRYGISYMNNRPVRAHRAAYIFCKGEIPAGMFVCHSCDRPLCINPAHLWLGTALENNKDKVSKGRQTYGENVASAILTERQVDEIRKALADGAVGRRLAKEYGVSAPTISAIKVGRLWTSKTSQAAIGM